MKRSIPIITTLLLNVICFCSYSQTKTISNGTYKVRSVIVDSLTNTPIAGCLILFVDTNQGVTSDEKGYFELTGLKKNDSYKIEVSFMGYVPHVINYVALKDNDTIPTIRLKSDEITVEEAVVIGRVPPAVQIGDTTQFNADAFQTTPDATVEDLVSKMPGFEMVDGKLQAKGEPVTRVYINGKASFSNINEALNALPADAVRSIQLFDEASDEAKFSGYDDGQKFTTINIITKKSRFYNGNYTAGYGTDDKYVLRANTTATMKDNFYSFGLGSNNINQNYEQKGSYGGSGSGFNTSSGGRINYAGEFKNKINKKLRTKIAADYGYTNTVNQTNRYVEQDYFPNNKFTTRNNTSLSASKSNENSHRFNVNIESDINKTNKITFRPSLSFNNSGANSMSQSMNIVDGKATNKADTRRNNQRDGYNTGGTFTWMGKLAEKHSLTVNVSGNISDNESSNIMIGSNSFYRKNELIDSLINQDAQNISNGKNASARLRYTYYLSKRSRINMNYGVNYNKSAADKKTYIYDPTTGEYTDISEELSNVFDRNTSSQDIGLGYSYNIRDKISVNAGTNFQNTKLINDLVFPSQKHNSYSFNKTPFNANIKLNITKQKYFRLSVNGSSSLPSVGQLQDVVDNDNPLKVSTGNSSLKQSFSTNTKISYNSNNLEKRTSFSVNASLNVTNNSVANNTQFMDKDTVIYGVSVQKGAQLTSPVNVNGLWNTAVNATFSVGIDPIRCRFNATAEYSYSRNPSIYNNEYRFMTNNRASMRFSLVSNISKDIDFSVNTRTSYSHAVSSASNKTTVNITQNIGVRVNWIFYKGFFVETAYNYDYRHNSQNDNQDPDFNRLNMSLGKKFFKNRSLDLRVSVSDFLNEKKSYSYDVRDNYTQYSTNSILERFYMISMSYRFDTLKKNTGKKPIATTIKNISTIKK